MIRFALAALCSCAPLAGHSQTATANPAQIDWQLIDARGGTFSIARTETTVAQFRRFAQATGLVTVAEKRGGGDVYEGGWTKLPGATWSTPFGNNQKAQDNEPAAHITFTEAQAFCRWAGGALPTDAQWVTAAYTESRGAAGKPFAPGKTYAFPTGDSPQGAQCLADCGAQTQARAVKNSARLTRGEAHAPVGMTAQGVNGLFDMGGNLWEWVDEPPSGLGERRTRGGSWWYGAAQMRADYLQSKPQDTAVVYIGFRCAKSN
jgi:formylglycine-generating enzyme